MHPLPLVILLTLAADPDRTIPAGCREDYATCREDCTIDYGGSTAKYHQLTQCMDRCSHEQSDCTTRHYSLRDANLDSLPQREPASHDDDLRDSDTRPASSSAKPQDGVRRGVYRASEDEPAARTEPAVMEEPAKMKEPEPAPESEPEPAPKPSPAAHSTRASAKDEDIRIFDDPDPEPAPEPKATAPKPSAPLHPKPPPEPKKKDISDWDPNER